MLNLIIKGLLLAMLICVLFLEIAFLRLLSIKSTGGEKEND